MSKPKATIRRILGTVAMLMAGFGLYYNVQTASVAITGGFEKTLSEVSTQYFYPVFTVMSAVCVLCYILLCWAGFKLVLGREFSLRIFTGLMIFEVLFFLCLGPLWLVPVIGSSIGASTGVAAGGLMVQFLILFPLWAPVLLWWIERRPKNTNQEGEHVVCGNGG